MLVSAFNGVLGDDLALLRHLVAERFITLDEQQRIALGLWIDEPWKGSVSWILNLLIIGVLIGCLNAWYWVSKEGRHD